MKPGGTITCAKKLLFVRKSTAVHKDVSEVCVLLIARNACSHQSRRKAYLVFRKPGAKLHEAQNHLRCIYPLRNRFYRNADGEDRAFAYFAVDRDFTTVSVDDLFHYGQPQPGTLLSPGRLHAEFLESAE